MGQYYVVSSSCIQLGVTDERYVLNEIEREWWESGCVELSAGVKLCCRPAQIRHLESSKSITDTPWTPLTTVCLLDTDVAATIALCVCAQRQFLIHPSLRQRHLMQLPL